MSERPRLLRITTGVPVEDVMPQVDVEMITGETGSTIGCLPTRLGSVCPRLRREIRHQHIYTFKGTFSPKAASCHVPQQPATRTGVTEPGWGG